MQTNNGAGDLLRTCPSNPITRQQVIMDKAAVAMDKATVINMMDEAPRLHVLIATVAIDGTVLYAKQMRFERNHHAHLELYSGHGKTARLSWN